LGLVDVADELPRPATPAPYYSQRKQAESPSSERSLEELARRVYQLVRKLDDQHFFSKTIGYDCVDAYGDTESSAKAELDSRVGKHDLWDGEVGDWTEDDLCDFIEVFHDLAARPTREMFHSYSGCGWHPLAYSQQSGQALYRWWMNDLLDTSNLGLRLADDGEDVGRLVHSTPGALSTMVDEALADEGVHSAEVAHAVHLFRSRHATRIDKRSAIVTLAGILEQRRSLLQKELLSKDEDALFELANRYDLRHREAKQRTDYDEAFLEWIFYWYLATVQLIEQLLQRKSGQA